MLKKRQVGEAMQQVFVIAAVILVTACGKSSEPAGFKSGTTMDDLKAQSAAIARRQDEAAAAATAKDTRTAVSRKAAEDTSDEAYARFARMYQDRHFETLENELYEGHVNALKIIPALGGKTNVADILRSHNIRIGPNPDVTCLPMVKLANAPGCILTVYLTRRNRDRQTDLSGVPAHWFMAVNGTHFRPLVGWAQHVDQNDHWLDAGGMFGNADNR